MNDTNHIPDYCEHCRNTPPTTFVGFASESSPSFAFTCDACRRSVFEQYQRMGGMGNPVILSVADVSETFVRDWREMCNGAR